MNIFKGIFRVITGRTFTPAVDMPQSVSPKPATPKRSKLTPEQERIEAVIGPQPHTAWERWQFRINRLLRQYSQPERCSDRIEYRDWSR